MRMETADTLPGLQLAAECNHRPVFVSDSGDNTTAGAPGDLTGVLQAALSEERLGNSAIVGILAPKLVQRALKAGKGAKTRIRTWRRAYFRTRNEAEGHRHRSRMWPGTRS